MANVVFVEVCPCNLSHSIDPVIITIFWVRFSKGFLGTVMSDCNSFLSCWTGVIGTRMQKYRAIETKIQLYRAIETKTQLYWAKLG